MRKAGADDRLHRYQRTSNALCAETWYLADPARQRRHRDEWPELWETIDNLVSLVDEDLHRLAPRKNPLFGTSPSLTAPAPVSYHRVSLRCGPIDARGHSLEAVGVSFHLSRRRPCLTSSQRAARCGHLFERSEASR